jgi:DNA processing protein
MQWEPKGSNVSKQQKLFVELEPEEKKLMDILQHSEACSIDYLVLQSKLSTSKIASILLNLEFKGLVKNMPGKMYKSL